MLVLLAMSFGRLVPQGSEALQVIVKPFVNGGSGYILVRQLCSAIANMKDRSQSA